MIDRNEARVTRGAQHGLRAWLAAGLLALLSTGAAEAADYHVCDCASGADAQCVVGSDAATGTTPAAAWRSYDRAQDAFANLLAGDAIHFCRGGVFPIAGSTQWVNTLCTGALRCTVDAYAAPWANGDEARPRLVQSTGHGFNLSNFGEGQQDGGYVFRDLEITCTACTGSDWGFFLFNDVDDVRLERLLIRNFGIGVHLAGSNPCGGDPQCDAHSSRIEMVSSEVRDNLGQGWLGAGNDLLLADNRFIGNGSGSVFEHNLYLTQSNGATRGMRVLRNELYRSAARDTGSCQGGSFAAHGEHTDLLIEGNYIHEDIGAADPACWGLGLTPAYSTPEYFVRTIVRGNRLRNVGNAAIAIASCVDCLVENNIIEHAQTFGVVAILAPAVARGPEDAAMTRLTVRNNSVWASAPNSTAVRLGGEGTQHVIVSNALQSTANTGSWACLSLGLAFGSYAAVDHNVCGFVAGGGREWEEGSGSLAAWRGASGFDTGSIAAAPGFAGAGAPAYDMRAAAISAAMVAAGHPTASSPLEFGGSARGTPPDAGAHQFGVSAVVFTNGFEN